MPRHTIDYIVTTLDHGHGAIELQGLGLVQNDQIQQLVARTCGKITNYLDDPATWCSTMKTIETVPREGSEEAAAISLASPFLPTASFLPCPSYSIFSLDTIFDTRNYELWLYHVQTKFPRLSNSIPRKSPHRDATASNFGAISIAIGN